MRDDKDGAATGTPGVGGHQCRAAPNPGGFAGEKESDLDAEDSGGGSGADDERPPGEPPAGEEADPRRGLVKSSIGDRD
uniref:Uncharacterized protein n=1 Tax=Oryza glumipatula TaxID=40148 RepID=A0A0D9YAW0_9ORYZ